MVAVVVVGRLMATLKSLPRRQPPLVLHYMQVTLGLIVRPLEQQPDILIFFWCLIGVILLIALPSSLAFWINSTNAKQQELKQFSESHIFFSRRISQGVVSLTLSCEPY